MRLMKALLCRFGLGLAVLWLAMPDVLLGADKWTRMESSHFELYTNAGKGRARRTLSGLEQVHEVMAKIFGVNLSDLPIRVFVFASKRDFLPYQSGKDKPAYFKPGTDRDYVVVQNLGTQINRAVYHEYTHLILNRSASRLPLWLEEGSAEMFSTMAVSKNNVQVGAGLAYAVALLRGKRLLSGEELQAVRHTSPIYNEGKRAGPFYAQSWAVVHMLNFDPRYSGRIGYFLNALDDQETEEAFAGAFGKTLNEAMDDLKEYIQQDRFQMMVYKAPVTRFKFKGEAEAVSEKDATLVLSDLLLELRRPQKADDLISELSAEARESGEVMSRRGRVALLREQYPIARRHFEKSLELGNREAATLYYYSRVLREQGAPAAEIENLVLEAAQLQPTFPLARFAAGSSLLNRRQYGAAPFLNGGQGAASLDRSLVRARLRLSGAGRPAAGRGRFTACAEDGGDARGRGARSRGLGTDRAVGTDAADACAEIRRAAAPRAGDRRTKRRGTCRGSADPEAVRNRTPGGTTGCSGTGASDSNSHLL